MAVYPGAYFRPLRYGTPTTMTRYDLVSYHTMVGSLAGTDSMFRAHGYADGTFSHFGVGADGLVYQWCDTAYRAAANLDGNPRIISIECADFGTGFLSWNTNDGSAVPAFTSAQISALVNLTDWICATHGIPRVEAPDSQPGSRGLGWHRKGVESSPPYRPGYRVNGGEHWSTSVGKVCPGDRRIAQIQTQIIPAVKSGTLVEEVDMTPEQAAQMTRIEQKLDLNNAVDKVTQDIVGGADPAGNVRNMVIELLVRLADVSAKLDATHPQ